MLNEARRITYNMWNTTENVLQLFSSVYQILNKMSH